jgi:hypothetical protein
MECHRPVFDITFLLVFLCHVEAYLLQLYNRYFHDSPRVISDQGGVNREKPNALKGVIEKKRGV